MTDNFAEIFDEIALTSKVATYEWISEQAFPTSKEAAQMIYQALLEREAAGDIQIEEGVILPHLEHSALTKTQIWLIRPEEPITEWSERIAQVELIIVVLLAENETLAVKRRLADFMRKLADPDYLDDLKAGNFAEP
ncbi:PTS sugar transporter subunit IIA [Enterococcus sp. DIV1298c]|uniref:PTS sugar transporter subunit IIA n=1 Tax=Enterococcus sp. DIV1298c TaxID=2815328 RepID=UPI001A9378A0|nr:PTS sugar transporter subunit IIA [Enterococcus sp. DIV1298c]MBO0462266.1 PTS sugar transporter subunit IIA [Enterococcus sp. DIV1298c]